jgi:hypothetical protein
MNLEDTKKLVNGVIENEFNHIQEFQEDEDICSDMQIETLSKKADDLLKKLMEIAPEHKDLLDDFDSAAAGYWAYVCRYYFKKGVVAGTTNLKFLEDTSIMHLV